MGKGLDKSFSNKIINWEEQEVALGRWNARSARRKEKLEFKSFSSPDAASLFKVGARQWKDSVMESKACERC